MDRANREAAQTPLKKRGGYGLYRGTSSVEVRGMDPEVAGTATRKSRTRSTQLTGWPYA